MNETKPERVGWPRVEALCDQLAAEIRDSGWEPTCIVGMARGGFTPAHLIAVRLDVPRAAAFGFLYADAERRRPPLAYEWPASVGNSDRTLVVEDAIVTGRGALLAVNHLRATAESVRVATLYTTVVTPVIDPDYVAVRGESEAPRFPWNIG